MLSAKFCQNYIELSAAALELFDPRYPRSESMQYGLWNGVLQWHFSIFDHYLTKPQDRYSLQRDRSGWCHLHTSHKSPSAPKAKKFLIVKCKKARRQRDGRDWRNGEAQLKAYMRAARRGRRHRPRAAYGFLAIGCHLQVYKYNGITKSIYQWAPRGMRPRRFDLRIDYRAVQCILNYIRRHH